ncbi:MAG: stage V sporulation protein D [Bacilli bacterium]|nr:stage V sporulation protein D [Bacilli bacterium]
MFFKDIHVKIRLFFVIVIILFLTIIAKVLYIQVFEYDKLKNLSSDLWSRNLPIEADRGKIYDRNKVVLADNITTTSLILIPNQIKEKEKTIKELSKILNISESKMAKHVNKKTSIERVHPEGRRLSFEVSDKINALNLDGVYLVKESKRNYPYDSNLSHVLGYVGIDNQGLSGLELEYDKYLTGSYGSIKYFSDAKGNRLKLNEIYEEPQNGMNLTLTIDNNIQLSVERELDNVVYKYNPEHALAIVMDPNNGEILAMSSRPNFSPTNYQKYSIEEINRNLPIWMNYEPGSTFKIITLAASLQEDTIDLQNDHFYDGGSIRVANAKIKCWKKGGHGAETFLQVVENSCNPGFVIMGQKLGKERLFSYIDKFGFGKKTGIDLNGEATGIIFNLDRVGEVELATTAFGQGISTTPIQQITAVSAAINGGILYKPYIVKSVDEPETNSSIIKNKPTKVRRVIDKQTSKEVAMALESVVTNGTGRNAFIDGYRVGGKTGTAQKVENGSYMAGNYIVSFIGFLPADNPKVVVYVAIDNPKGVVQYGGTVSAPVAKNILEDSINALNIPKSDDASEKNYQFWEKKYLEVPNLVGKKLDSVTNELTPFEVQYTGSGDYIIFQSPSNGERVLEGSKIRILLGNK